MDNHRPGERQSMEDISAFDNRMPGTRTETWKWVNYFRTAVGVLFGPSCPLLDYLETYIQYLNEETRFRSFTAEHWRAYFWKYHLAVQGFFEPSRRANPRSVQEFEDFLLRIRMGLPVQAAELPRAMAPSGSPRQPTQADQGNNPGSGRSQGDNNPENSVGRRVAREWQHLLTRPLKDAKDAILAANKNWNMKVVFPNGAKEVFGGFGTQVQAGGNGSRDPCPRLFAYGKCSARRCNCSHSLAREPMSTETRAYIDWVQRRCAEIKNTPGNF